MSKNKINQLIRLEDLAAAYSELIGNKYNISSDFNLDIKSNKEMAYLRATRQPYKISNIKAESMQIVLRFHICCENKEKYVDDIQVINQLCGMNKMSFNSNGNDYKAYSFLDFAEPLGEPVIDCGKWYNTVELRGNILVTQVEGGVLIGNEVETKIKVDIGKETEMEANIEVLAANTTLTKTQEAPQMANEDVAKAFNNSQVYSYSYTILLLKNAICERLLKAVLKIQPFGLNEKVIITETYPPFANNAPIIDTKSLIVTGSTFDRQAGAFVSINLTLQDRIDIELLDDEDNEHDYEQDSGTGGGEEPPQDPQEPEQPEVEELLEGNPFSVNNCSIQVIFDDNGTRRELQSSYIHVEYKKASTINRMLGFISEGEVSSEAYFGIINTSDAYEQYENAEDECYTIIFNKPFVWNANCRLILSGVQEVGQGVYFYDTNNNEYQTTDDSHDYKPFNIPVGTRIKKLIVDSSLLSLDSFIYLSIG